MSSSAQPTPEPTGPQQIDPTLQLLKFLREENNANRSAVREDAEANRKLLLDTVKFVSIPVSILIALAAFFGFKSVSDLKRTIQTEARHETSAEIIKMQGTVRQRLDDQFQTPALQKMVREAASESTKTAAEPLIKNEVATQVKARVDAERPAIANTVTQQTQVAVRQMGTQIDSLVQTAVATKLSAQMAPVVEQVNEVKSEADTQLLILRMNADDAEAFDTLMKRQTIPNSPQQALIVGALRNVINVHNGGGFFMVRSFTPPLSDQQVVAELDDKITGNRQAAIDTVAGKKQPNLLPKIVEMIRSDPSLDVRSSAHRLFNAWTGQKFQILDKDAVLQWWEANKQSAMSGP